MYTYRAHIVNMIYVKYSCYVVFMMDQAERLRTARLASGYKSARNAALEHGWTVSTYTAHENGQNGFSMSDAIKYGAAFGVLPGWLVGLGPNDIGKAKLLAEKAGPREIVRVPIGEEFDPDPQFQDDADRTGATRRVSRQSLGPGEVPERDVTAGLGGGGVAPIYMMDGKEIDGVRAVWRLPVDYLRTELNAREADVDFIPVAGDSMIPTLLPGDRVMVNRSQTSPSPDGLFAIFDGIGVAVKRLEVVKGSAPVRIRIKSDNPVHGIDEILADDLQVIGRVVCKVTRL